MDDHNWIFFIYTNLYKNYIIFFYYLEFFIMCEVDKDSVAIFAYVRIFKLKVKIIGF